MQLSQVADSLKLDFYGEDCEILCMNDLSNAKSGELSFALNKKFSSALENSKASAFLITRELIEKLPKNSSYIICDDVSISMAYASRLFTQKPVDDSLEKPKISESAYVDSRANLENGVVIGDNSTILAGSYIGKNVKIGSNTTIHANVSIYYDSIIGDNCIIHSGTVIGADGFGFSHTKTGEHIKIYQNGNTVIEDDVEIGA